MTKSPAGKRKKMTRQYHFAVGGVLYVAVTTLLMLGALNSQNNLLFAAMGVSIGGLVISGFLSGSALLGIRVERISTSDAQVGRPLTIRYRVHNKNRLVPAFALVVEECQARKTTRKSSWRHHFAVPRACIAHLGPGQSVECEAQVWPTRRGTVSLESIRVWSTFPIGIAKKSITEHVDPDEVVVRPLVVAIREAILRKTDGTSRSGRQPSRRAGQGDEFFSLREYQPGDPIRQIAWRATARTGDVLVTQPASPVPDRLRVVVRLSPDAQSHADNERAIALAASVISRAARDATMVGLSVPQFSVELPPGSGRRNADHLLDELGRLDLTTPFTPGPTPDQPTQGSRDSVIVVYADRESPPLDIHHARHIRADAADEWIASADAQSLYESLLPNPHTGAGPASVWDQVSQWSSNLWPSRSSTSQEGQVA
jgi:uncharacterized protein (DUF58 family)